MKNPLKLDGEEVKILRDFERGEFTSLTNFKQEKRQLEEAAHNFLRKDKRINIRISSRDLKTLPKKAAKEGMPYQTLISSTLHKFVTGKLKSVEQEIAKANIKAARRILRRKGGQPPAPEDRLP